MASRESFRGVLNFDSREQKRTFIAAAGILRGLYRVKLEPAADTRTNRQNALLWVIYTRAAKWLTDGTGGERVYTADEIHRAMGRRFLLEAIAHPDTGEVLDHYVRSTTSLSIDEMSVYIDQVQARLSDDYGVEPLERDEPESTGARHVPERMSKP